MTKERDTNDAPEPDGHAAAARCPVDRHLFPTAEEKQYPLPPSFVDGKVYTDPDQYAREYEKIFMQSWFPVCPSWDVQSPRDLVVWDRLRQSVVITRMDDGRIAAWHNVCQHRGARLVKESGQCKAGKVKCPWHGFAYNLAGEVTNVPLRESFDEATLTNLRATPIRAVEWSGFVWINFSNDAPSLQEYLGDLWGEIGHYRMDGFQTRYRTTVELHANWKVVVDAFNETWHVPFTHQETLAGPMLWRDAKIHVCPPHSWMTLPVAGFTERMKDKADHHGANVCHYLAFPNTIFSCFPTHLQMWTIWPVSAEETIIDAWGIVGPVPAGMSEEAWAKQNERDWAHFLKVVGENSTIINSLGTVAHSKGFGRLMFNTAESRLTAFHEEVKSRIS